MWVRLGLTLTAGLLGLSLLASAAGRGISGVRQIAYQDGYDGNFEIFLADAAHGVSVNLTRNPGEDSRPVWSPDGNQIVFYSQRERRIDLYLMNADGSGVRQLALSGGPGAYPAWSPDGQWIAYATSRQESAGIYLIRPDGTDIHQLTTFRAALMAWSPDSQKIAFMADCDNKCDLYMVDISGEHLRRLTRNGEFDAYPSWSPDGKRIVFMSSRDSYLELYALNTDCDENQPRGCPVTRLTFNRDFDGYPTWSPFGQLILFSAERDHNFDLYTLDVSCLDVPENCVDVTHRLTSQSTSDLSPVWSPDGAMIAFVSASDLLIMNADGTDVRWLAESVLSDQTLAWRPE